MAKVRNIGTQDLHRQGKPRRPGDTWSDPDSEWVAWASHPSRGHIKIVPTETKKPEKGGK